MGHIGEVLNEMHDFAMAAMTPGVKTICEVGFNAGRECIQLNVMCMHVFTMENRIYILLQIFCLFIFEYLFMLSRSFSRNLPSEQSIRQVDKLRLGHFRVDQVSGGVPETPVSQSTNIRGRKLASSD
jgi:hypothetical protein